MEDIQTKHRLSDTQLRQYRVNHDQLNQELQTSRRLSEQQLLSLNTKTQDALNKITVELDRTQRRLNEYERFTQVEQMKTSECNCLTCCSRVFSTR